VGNIGANAVYLGGYTNARFESNQITNNTTSKGIKWSMGLQAAINRLLLYVVTISPVFD